MSGAEGDDAQLFLKIAQVSDLRSLDAHTFEQFIQFVFRRFGFAPRLTNADNLNVRPTRAHLDLSRADAPNAIAVVVNGAADTRDVAAAIDLRLAQNLNTAFLVMTDTAADAVRAACAEHDVRLIDAHNFADWIGKSRLDTPAVCAAAPASLPRQTTKPSPRPTTKPVVNARVSAVGGVGLGVLLALNALGLVIALGVVGLVRYAPVLSASQTATVFAAATPRPSVTPTPTRTATPLPIPTIKLPATPTLTR